MPHSGLGRGENSASDGDAMVGTHNGSSSKNIISPLASRITALRMSRERILVFLKYCCSRRSLIWPNVSLRPQRMVMISPFTRWKRTGCASSAPAAATDMAAAVVVGDLQCPSHTTRKTVPKAGSNTDSG